MFWKKDKSQEALKSAVRDVSAIHSNSSGASRRATSMVPVAIAGTHEITHTSTVKFHQLIISIEGNQRTGCLRVISPSKKSRSAILIYKGRVVGCLYGSKKLQAQFLQKDAHYRVLSEIATPGNVLDAYELPEELVLAAASIFNGQVIAIETHVTGKEALDEAMRAVASTKLPGCVVVSTTDEEMVCMVYLSRGAIIGIFSARDGWIEPSYEVAMQFAQGNKLTSAKAAFMPLSASQNHASLGFSLSGIADPSKKPLVQQKYLQAIDSFTTIGGDGKTHTSMQTMKNTGAANPDVAVKRPQYTRWNKDAISVVKSHNTFAISP